MIDMNNLKRVTFLAKWKSGKKFKSKTIVEYTNADVGMIRLRALALNWTLVSIEDVEGQNSH